jgi:hypothetical protein
VISYPYHMCPSRPYLSQKAMSILLSLMPNKWLESLAFSDTIVMDFDTAFLALGRLDGRLTHSPAAQPWLIKARLEGAAIAACNAGVPVAACDLEAWISGRRNPPRAAEGLNDPMSVAAVVYYYFTTLEQSRAVNDTAVTRLLRSIFSHKGEAEIWADADLIHYGPLWRALSNLADAPGMEPTIAAVAARLRDMARVAIKAEGRRQIAATSFNGSELVFSQDDRRAWLISFMVPRLLQRAGITSNLIPSLVPTMRFLDGGSVAFADKLKECICRNVPIGHKSLNAMERKVAGFDQLYRRTARSRLRLAAELGLALPSLSRQKLAIAVNSTPAGAGYILRHLGR